MPDSEDIVNSLPDDLEIARPAALMAAYRSGDISLAALRQLRAVLDSSLQAAVLGATQADIDEMDARIRREGGSSSLC